MVEPSETFLSNIIPEEMILEEPTCKPGNEETFEPNKLLSPTLL